MGDHLKLGWNTRSNESANISERTSGKLGVKACGVGHCSSSSQVSNTRISCSSRKRMSGFRSCRPLPAAPPQGEATSPPSVPAAPSLLLDHTRRRRQPRLPLTLPGPLAADPFSSQWVWAAPSLPSYLSPEWWGLCMASTPVNPILCHFTQT